MFEQTSIFDPRFDGSDYDPASDFNRLKTQLDRVREYMTSTGWHTLSEIERGTGDPAASISAQLRNLRKERFGSFKVEKRPRGDRVNGLFEYKITKHEGSIS